MESLEITLNSIMDASLSVESGDLEIIIGDNSTNKHALALVNRMSSSQSRVKIEIIQNLQNIGYDKNVLNLLLAATGRYAWFLGDRLSVTAPLAPLIENLQTYSPGFVCFPNLMLKNGKRCTKTEVIENFDFKQGHDFHFFDVENLDSLNLAVLDSSISSRIFVMADELKLLNSKFERYVGSQFMHAPIFYESMKLARSGKVLITAAEFTFSRSVIKAFRFDAVAMTLGWTKICMDYDQPIDKSHKRTLDFFLNNGLKEYRLGLGSIGITDYRDFVRAMDKLDIPLPKTYLLRAVIYGFLPKNFLRFAYISINVIKRRLPFSIRSISGTYKSMRKFDQEITDFSLDSGLI